MDNKKAVKKEETKDEVLEDIGITQEQLDALVQKLAAGELVTASKTDELFAAQAQALQQIAEQSMPTNVKRELERLDAEYESPYVMVDSKIAVLLLSTSDLERTDGWPGYIDEPIAGQFTAQGLQKRARIELIPHYEPGLEASYSLRMMDRKEYEDIAQGGAGNMSRVTAVSSLMRRATGDR